MQIFRHFWLIFDFINLNYKCIKIWFFSPLNKSSLLFCKSFLCLVSCEVFGVCFETKEIKEVTWEAQTLLLFNLAIGEFIKLHNCIHLMPLVCLHAPQVVAVVGKVALLSRFASNTKQSLICCSNEVYGKVSYCTWSILYLGSSLFFFILFFSSFELPSMWCYNKHRTSRTCC